MRHLLFGLITATIVLSIVGVSPVFAVNSNLFVSAENSEFDNYFAGSMIIEVVVNDPNLKDLDEGKGEPDVTINGKILRMVQASDGNWYAYFANMNKAKIADQISFDGGVGGAGLDFGVFCDRNTSVSVFGVDFSDTDGFAVPGNSGLFDFTNGQSSFSECTGSLSSSDLNNVVRKAKSINNNPNVATGQIGLDANAWPVIQLYSFDDVTITYNPGGQSQTVNLEYDEVPNISIKNDRELYPSNSEVFLTISDIQLNQDPTDEDSWTFSVGSSPKVFYQAFDSNGSNSANGNSGLIDLLPHLNNLGFEDNGLFSMTTDSIISLKTNDNQPSTSVNDGTNSFSNIVTFVESTPNSGIFESFDNSDTSVIGIISNVPRGLSDSITYNDSSATLLSGSSTAYLSTNSKPSISIDNTNNQWRPGVEIPVIVQDPDQNINSASKDDLDLFRTSSIIPTIKIGNPITLSSSSGVQIYEFSTTPLSTGINIPTSVPDLTSSRLLLDTNSVTNTEFEKVSINLGVSANDLKQIMINPNLDIGTNWFNFDLRSLNLQLELTDLSDTSFSLHFGNLPDASPIIIAESGDLNSFQDLIQIDNDDVNEVFTKSGTVFLVINFDNSNNSSAVARILDEIDSQPIIFDIFSFGLSNNEGVNNSIYRFELEESSDNSGIFEGTLEYAVSNQLNIATSDLVKTLRPIDDQIKFLVTDRLLDDQGITISYSDLAQVGLDISTSVKSDIRTHSGIVSTDSSSYGFGRPVTIVLNDPDLNLKHNRIDIYQVINDPKSPNVDTVGASDGSVLLEVIIKGIKYQRCIIDGIEHGGLGSTGFTLVETTPTSGIFQGTFKMPSQICNKTGDELIYTSGGNIDLRYFDFRDSSGEQNIVTLSRQKSTSSIYQTSPQLNSYNFVLPNYPNTVEVILTGSIDGHKRGVPVWMTLVYPDNSEQNFIAYPTNSGNYRGIFSLNSASMTGHYAIHISYQDDIISTTSFNVEKNHVLSDIKNNAKNWSGNAISDSHFKDDIRLMIDQKLIDIPTDKKFSFSTEQVPSWLRDIAILWTDNMISDKEYLKAIEFLVKKGIIRI